MMKKTYNASEAAQYLSKKFKRYLSITTIRRKCALGQVKCKKVDGAWSIDFEEMDKIKVNKYENSQYYG